MEIFVLDLYFLLLSLSLVHPYPYATWEKLGLRFILTRFPCERIILKAYYGLYSTLLFEYDLRAFPGGWLMG